MNKNDLLNSLNNTRAVMDPQSGLKLIYVLKAWKVLSDKNKIEDNDLKFETYYNQKIESKKLLNIFEKLAKQHKVFELFLDQNVNVSKLESSILVVLLNAVNDNEILDTVNDVFFNLDVHSRRKDFSISNQIAELGIKLLNENTHSIYVPFTDGFAVSYNTDQKIYADFMMAQNAFIAELVKIVDDKDIIFNVTDALVAPSFINPDAPHLLKQFDSVLSFPPFNLKGKIDLSLDKFNRFKIHRGTNLSVALFEHILAQTKHRSAVLLPVGFAYRTGAEESFRKYLIENNWLEAIVQLPPNLHSATSIETTFFVVNKKKEDNKVYFINLKDEQFLKRDGKKIVLSSVDDIMNIYNDKKEIENISALISNETIMENSYSLTIDRYVISKEAASIKEKLASYEMVELQSLADIRRSQLFKDEGEGDEIYELSPSDLATVGFTLGSRKTKLIGSQYNKYQTYKLQPYDVLVSTKGTIGKVGIIGEINKPMIASQAIQVIRVKGSNDIKDRAVELYMFFKSDIGQGMLKQLVAGVAMPQIATAEIKQLKIPVLSNSERRHILLNFNNEISLYEEIEEKKIKINKIHSNFLGEN